MFHLWLNDFSCKCQRWKTHILVHSWLICATFLILSTYIYVWPISSVHFAQNVPVGSGWVKRPLQSQERCSSQALVTQMPFSVDTAVWGWQWLNFFLGTPTQNIAMAWIFVAVFPRHSKRLQCVSITHSYLATVNYWCGHSCPALGQTDIRTHSHISGSTLEALRVKCLAQSHNSSWQGSNRQPFNHWLTCSTTWATGMVESVVCVDILQASYRPLQIMQSPNACSVCAG